jgi:hypothetical protein
VRDGGGRDGGFGERRFDRERGPGRGSREQRIYTVEPAKEIVETITHKGEVTSLASLRALLGGGKKAPEATPPAPTTPPAPAPAPVSPAPDAGHSA